MSNSSSATKLAELQGLEAAKRFLRQIFTREDSPHAVLFYGAPGSGKSTLAGMLAEFWLCTEPTEEGACGQCRACRAFAEGSNPDALSIEPHGASRWLQLWMIQEADRPQDAPNKPPMLTFLRTMPVQSRSKVVLIEEVDRLNSAAANSLLKTLEEPPPYARLVLSTSFVGQIPPTILSRCVAIACEVPKLNGATSVGELHWIEQNREAFEEIEAIAEEVRRTGGASALRLSDRLRAVSERIAQSEETKARHAQCDALAQLAQAFARRGMSGHSRATIDVHRRVVMNGSLGLNCDALFAGFAALR